jgi:uncharacterized repeat protein (TIGR04052 family)
MRPLTALLLALSLTACNDGKDDHDHDHDDTDAADTDETDVADDTDAEPAPTAFSLPFAAVLDGVDVGCGDALTGLGPDGTHGAGINDLRFYVSNVVFRDAAGDEVPVTFDEDDFQYTGATGWVALIDLTGNTDGDCDAASISFSEGTARTHTAITGTTRVDLVASVSFDVGIPQPLMQEVIAENTVEGAPSPLAEMYWSWASGYRHFVFNLTTTDGETDGEGYLHIGSRGCAGDGELALETKDACDYVNTPAVALDDFDLTTDTVTVDLGQLFEGLDFISPLYDPVTYDVIGEAVGVECHSGPSQPDCDTLFSNFGVDFATGTADPSANLVFGAR